MLRFWSSPLRNTMLRRLLWGTGVCLLLSLCMVGKTWAQAAQSEAAAPCSSCHAQETEAWQNSPHAQISLDTPDGRAAATCTDCHGEYVNGHPYSATISLTVDSSMCQSCHATTYAQWEDSLHAQNNVQCISCHSSHSQDLRLTDESLCQSCHHESLNDPLHSAHWQAGATCTECHLTVATELPQIASTEPVLALSAIPSHDFVSVSARNCLECHREDASADATQRPSQAGQWVGDNTADRIQETSSLTAKLDQAEWTQTVLETLSVTNLGFGIGIGGMLGVVFMLIAARSNRGRRD